MVVCASQSAEEERTPDQQGFTGMRELGTFAPRDLLRCRWATDKPMTSNGRPAKSRQAPSGSESRLRTWVLEALDRTHQSWARGQERRWLSKAAQK